MSPDQKQYELDRVVNTIRSFGWSMVSFQTEGDKVAVQFSKNLPGMNMDLKKFELDRIAGMVKNIGWDLVTSRFEEDKAIVSFEKIIKVLV